MKNHAHERRSIHLGQAFALLGIAVVAVAGAACSSSAQAARSARATPTAPIASTALAARGIRVTLPAPTGPYPVGTSALHLIDRTRPDPLKASMPYRELMVSLWYPTRGAARSLKAPWMLPLAAADWDQHSAPGLGIKSGAVDWAGIRTHARVDAPVIRDEGRLRVVLFSTGDGGPRAIGTTLVEDLASRGYFVITVDHTYEADQVEFPGGRVERAVPLPEKLTEQVIADLLLKHSKARVKDMKFVLDQLPDLDRGRSPDADGQELPTGIRRALNLKQIGILGASMGGSVAAQVAHDDRRVDAAANLDGEFFGRVARTGVRKPFLLMAANSRSHQNQPTWKTFWAASTGWKRQVSLAGAEHGSFTDLQVLLPQLKSIKGLPIAELIGTIDPQRSLSAQREVISDFFDKHLRGDSGGLFDVSEAQPAGVRFR